VNFPSDKSNDHCLCPAAARCVRASWRASCFASPMRGIAMKVMVTLAALGALVSSSAGGAAGEDAPQRTHGGHSMLGAADRAAVNRAAVKRELEATFAARMHAFEVKDYATIMAQVSPQFTAVRPDGSTMNRDDIAGYIRKNLDRWVRIVRQSNVIERLRLDDKGNAVADMRQKLGRIQIVDGKEVLVETEVLQTETWTPTPTGWKLLKVRDERDKKLSLDGKPVR
jgi:hypothetical protein